MRAARIAAGHGARVMIAEEYRIGGTCVIRGCVPKKLLVYASHILRRVRGRRRLRLDASRRRRFDWPTLVANKDKEIARLEGTYTHQCSRRPAPRSSRPAPCSKTPTRVRLRRPARASRPTYILIATGSAPDPGPTIPGIEHVISSNEAFHLPELPKRIVIQGGGYIAVEFACIFAGLGVRRHAVYRGDNILRGFDEDVRVHLRDEMEKRGITVIYRLHRHGDREARQRSSRHAFCRTARASPSDQVMFAIGRQPNVKGLGLEKAGVALNRDNGGIAVDGFSRTSVPNIYAIGDVTHRINLTPVAIREGHAFADTRVRQAADRRSTTPHVRPRCSRSPKSAPSA